MIQPTELRIGNLFNPISRKGEVHLPIDVAFKVYELYSFTCKAYGADENPAMAVNHSIFSYSDLSPIPLTEEWLLRLGFKNSNGLYNFGEYTYSFRQSDLLISDSSDDKYIGITNRPTENEVQYVHQLQNLYFALTGEELTYTPSPSPQR